MDSDKEKELAEIKRRLDYLITTDEISDSEKVAILKNALEIIENSKGEMEVQ
jgi:hypothetical protein